MSSSLDKKKLRLDFQKKLDQISFMDLIVKSDHLVESFKKNIIKPAHYPAIYKKNIVSFYPFGSEPQINIESEKNDEPYLVAYVRITDWSQREMVAALARRDQPGQWEEIEISDANKIFQPSPNQPICKPDEISIILVPGMAFTPDGKRLGRGAGFYDRFLRQNPQALRVGICFEEQLTKTLPTDEWDENVDVILTDQGIHQVIEMNMLGEWKTQGKISNRSNSTF